MISEKERKKERKEKGEREEVEVEVQLRKCGEGSSVSVGHVCLWWIQPHLLACQAPLVPSLCIKTSR